jgi:polyphosphate:AMP phosphotransferase
MLEKIDLSKKIEKSEYNRLMPDLQRRLGEVQRQIRELNIPIIIVFEGWDAAGKGTMINRLSLALDPRGFSVHPINPPTQDEKYRPFLWRFWIRTPERGRIAIFDRSWYGRVLVERVDRLIKRKEWGRAFQEITSFERQLSDDGNIIIKFFLHISKKEQKKRFEALLDNPATAWKVKKEDWEHHRQYKKYWQANNDMLAETDTHFAPWKIIEVHDRRFATIKIFQTVIIELTQRIKQVQRHKKTPEIRESSDNKFNRLDSSILDKADLSLSLSREKYERSLKKYQEQLRDLEHQVYTKRIPVIIIYAGWDAGGKGGNIKRLVAGLDPRGYEVIPVAAPNDLEKAHHYLWRFWLKIPKAGHFAIFDRSWYGRVMVERIEGFCTEKEWKRAYNEINEMEKQLVNFGTILIKFWLHIDQKEQLRRFKERESLPYKKWKITSEDWRNREKWDRYKVAIDEMLYRTSTNYAPWTIVESNCKLYARIKTLSTVVHSIEERI